MAKKSFAMSTSRGLLGPATKEELQACWELCRFHRNIGFWVAYIPTALGILMAYHAQPQLPASTALMRAAVYIPLCFGIKSLISTIDDILDSDIDVRVERTKNRAIPRGAISLPRAWMFFGIQVIIGIYLAYQVLSPSALRVSIPAWPLYIIYPTCKRWTYLTPLPLGLMFGVGIFMAWYDLSIDGVIPWGCLLPVYIGTCLWNFTYETIYQHLDKADDVKIGVRSPALLLGDKTIPVCSLTAIGFLATLCYGGAMNGQGPAYFVAVAFTGVKLLTQLLKTNVDSADDCAAFFMQTPMIGQIIVSGLLIDVVSHRLMNGIPL